MSATTAAFLRLSPARSATGEPIVFLFGRHLPPATDGASAAETVAGALSVLPPGPFSLVYCHAGVGETSIWGVRAFRTAYERVPRILRERISQCGEYGKLVYCDLISDLERHLGIDALLAGIDNADVEYDGVMRTWVARDDEIRPSKRPDPQQPLLDITKIDWSTETAESPPTHTAQSDEFVIGSERV